MSTRSPRHSADQWASYIAEFDQRSETIQTFCARHRLAVSTFSKWRTRLGAGTLATDLIAPRNASAAFVEAIPATAKSQTVTLHVNDVVRLELPVSIGTDTIADLTRAVLSRVSL